MKIIITEEQHKIDDRRKYFVGYVMLFGINKKRRGKNPILMMLFMILPELIKTAIKMLIRLDLYGMNIMEVLMYCMTKLKTKLILKSIS